MDIIKGRVLFGTRLFANVKKLFATVSVGTAFWNSLRNTVLGTAAAIFICSMAGYGFQIYRD
ncbi:MAG: carbohydrate ABC transporter permease, partial [Treponema sp.]|nr:carbohydrate ABC transporter permease [Treponema sp.]